MNDEEAAEHIQAFDNNGNGKIEFGVEFLKILGEGY
ncbi:EF-hand-like domain [Penicillium roqueforti FM164]|uniref:EF-hand-like domain n=1 Tax=Penicillium roqueforti (strain FM164) TaxID=1365484 RepID=W6QPT1_PENRF|nr:EF-hand-like domain [Penicillium roqueforti FM164]